jgi:tetratricopeptide (TPR) repeat protein
MQAGCWKPNPNTMRLTSFLITTVLLLTCAAGHAQSANELIAKGDALDLKFQAEAALQNYLPAEKMEPQNVRLLVHIARQYRYLMYDAKTSAEKLRLGGIALGYGQRAAALGPNDAEAQLSTAITYGKMLPFQSSREQVAATPLIKRAADKALRLDPRNDVAWHVLGRWHQVLADIGTVKRTLGGLIYGKLPPSTHDEAVVCFDKAISLNPRRLRHHIELGRTYAQMGKNVEARKLIEKGLAMPNLEKDDPELKQRGRETLAKLP